MRLQVKIDDALMVDAMALSGLKTKKATVEAALRLLARTRLQPAAASLDGPTGDSGAARAKPGTTG